MSDEKERVVVAWTANLDRDPIAVQHEIDRADALLREMGVDEALLSRSRLRVAPRVSLAVLRARDRS